MVPAIPLTAEELAIRLQDARNVNYVNLAGFIIVYFDWLLTFDSEIRLIWSVEGVKMKVLYAFTRYLPLTYFPLFFHYHFITGHPVSECNKLYQTVGLMFTIAAICAALIVTIRTWAVWGKEKYMTYLLFGTYTVASVLILVFFILSVEYTTHPVLNLGLALGCNPKFETLYLPAAFVVEAVYDTAILLLMVIRGASHFRQGINSRLSRTVYSDSILFYVYISIISIANFGLLFSRGGYRVFLLMFQGGARSVLACRIVLRIRVQYDKLQVKKPLNTKTGYAPQAVHIRTTVIQSSDA
ncbi:hypothetical protein AGABI2DRAFT_117401 [Agaricus bisporus var. bisporus H97]|uniref:hypothetical protein n=1 Tax=Agaricus bisporus var. bisporus (strain H97 / ATCC MYA-4626 / FGSC 10389) TaxID=936046 RepID=UPI00029F7A4D|nr:hypothetical protein AGABI2DRAFT_117401 [Agaricus bisporus var. bisporus H97]EKV48592.1 hypothetical protein AGABI2DRAFT_117401 [Agaricus bisporus var. bisporus H97]